MNKTEKVSAFVVAELKMKGKPKERFHSRICLGTRCDETRFRSGEGKT